MNDNLPELKDIHLPESVSVWPPAYGWYIVILLIILFFFGYKIYKKWYFKSRKYYALKLLGNLNSDNIIKAGAQISEILRRACLCRYPQAVVLEGKKWQDFLLSHCSAVTDKKTVELLINAPYLNPEKHSYTQKELNNLIIFAQNWIGENL